MTNPQWKRTERAIARLLGGRRVPITGRGRGDVPDIAHPWMSIECKERQQLPAWLMDACAAWTTSRHRPRSSPASGGAAVRSVIRRVTSRHHPQRR